jgi:uncharacterized protein
MLSSGRPQVRIRELESSAKLTRPTVVVGIPETGLVGTIAASYLVEQLKLPEIAFVDSDLLPQVVVVRDSEPKEPVRIFGKGALVVVVSEVPLMAVLSYELASEMARWTKARQGKMVVGVTGIASEDRVESAGKRTPMVFAVTNDEATRNSIKAIGAKRFEHGVIASTYATLLRRCASLGVPNLTLLAECYAGFPDPGAAAAALQVLSKLLEVPIDVKQLLDGEEETRLRLRELMNQTQQTIQQDVAQSPTGVYH